MAQSDNDREAILHGEYKVPGGKLLVADVTVRDGRLASVQLSGDFSSSPTRRWRRSTKPSRVRRSTPMPAP
ncbi:hypothetical protein NYA28ABAC_03836 [Salinicola sp. NYA28a]